MKKHSYLFATLFIFAINSITASEKKPKITYSVGIVGRDNTIPIFVRDQFKNPSEQPFDLILRASNSKAAYRTLKEGNGLMKNPCTNPSYRKKNPHILSIQRINALSPIIDNLQARHPHQPYYTIYLERKNIPSFVRFCNKLPNSFYNFRIIPVVKNDIDSKIVERMRSQIAYEADKATQDIIYSKEIDGIFNQINIRRKARIPKELTRIIKSFLGQESLCF